MELILCTYFFKEELSIKAAQDISDYEECVRDDAEIFTMEPYWRGSSGNS